MQDNFLAKLSHEIRTPINAIIGFGYLFQQTRLDDQQRKYLTSITDSAKDLLHIFQEMLDYSQMEESGFALNPLPFRLDTIIQNIITTIEPRCRAKSLLFRAHVEKDVPPELTGDAMRISQILLNLTGNAIKFTEKGSVSLHVSCTSDGAISFKVIDTGIGIPEASCKEIFKPFIQVDNSHTRDHGGAGLGLATCFRLTKAMQGSISVAPNKEAESGSIFDVTLPLSVPSVSEKALNDSPITSLKILVVDHEPLSQQVTESTLQSLGTRVSIASNGEDALQKIAEADNTDDPFKVIVLTWRMPGMNGIEAATYVQEMTLRHAPILILHSQYCLNEVEQLAKDAGIAAALSKPTSPAEFQKLLTELLENIPETTDIPAQNDDDADDGPARILLVEDNEINQEIAYEVLKAAQLEVDIANNGQEAVDAVEKQKYSLVLMDVQMPIMDGLEATRRIRAAGYRMPIIAMTAHAMLDDKETSLSAGMNAHLTKPLEPMALFAAINSLLPARTTAKKENVTKPTVAPIRKNKLPENLEGFNLISGLATVGGNETLYAGLLVKFADRYATINEDISACLQNNDLETAVRHAHTVRGIAANLGAEALAEAAENLEKTITHNPNMITPHLRTLIVRLTEAVSAIIENLGDDGLSGPGESAVPIEERLNVAEREHACHVLTQAILHMEQDWGHASDTVIYLKERLKGTPLESPLAQLQGAIEDFEVEKAQAISIEAQKLLHVS